LAVLPALNNIYISGESSWLHQLRLFLSVREPESSGNKSYELSGVTVQVLPKSVERAASQMSGEEQKFRRTTTAHSHSAARLNLAANKDAALD
jgi:hypothetical protein